MIALRKNMTSPVQELLQKSVPLASALPDGKYTLPRSWGVYEIKLSKSSLNTQRFRFGNHPIRQQELAAEFSSVELVALFWDRTNAKELAHLLNTGSNNANT